MTPHAWTGVIVTELLEEERCQRCRLRRWRAPSDGRPAPWHYGNGDGRWQLAPLKAGCVDSASGAETNRAAETSSSSASGRGPGTGDAPPARDATEPGDGEPRPQESQR